MKLVRNKIPHLMDKGELRGNRDRPFTFRSPTGPRELEVLLLLKLAEEVGEVLSAPTRAERVSELGDLRDVIDAIEDRLNLTDVERAARDAKRGRLGGFALGWVLEEDGS
jgi:predicted house-cleaning noncanonical NTP pyrophosphatase (MazG superfamily)